MKFDAASLRIGGKEKEQLSVGTVLYFAVECLYKWFCLAWSGECASLN